MSEDEGVRIGVFPGTPSEHSTATRALSGEADARAVADAVAACRTWWRVGAATRRMVSVNMQIRTGQGEREREGASARGSCTIFVFRARQQGFVNLIMRAIVKHTR